MIRRLGSSIVLGALLLGCGGGGGDGGPSGPTVLQVAGSYDATFRTTRVEGCQGFVPEGATSGTLRVSQSGTAVTLHLSDLSDSIETDPTGELSGISFTYFGPIRIGNEQESVEAQGSITGSFDRDGSLDLTFDYTVLTCAVEGTIVGDRR